MVAAPAYQPGMLTRRGALIGLIAALPAATLAQAPPPVDPGFQPWLTAFRRDALAAGLRPATLDAAFAGLAPIPRVIELDRRQPEATLGFAEYFARVVNDARVRAGKQRLVDNAALLQAIQARYRVPPSTVVALWAMETDFGRFGGNFPVIGALATLAYEGRRADYFRKELVEALWILEDGGFAPAQMRGSWAGAMGQVQFMPSTYRRHAVDWDGDGRRDIWTSTPDALGSAANYLSQSGWNGAIGWGEEVRAPAGFNAALTGRPNKRPPEEWQRMGVEPLARASFLLAEPFALVLPDNAGGRAFAVSKNIDVLMTWNRSIYFALSVAMLAERIDTE
jgi:membrane-bound lytic murein transglycosylase B